jgi:hypothetical protein
MIGLRYSHVHNIKNILFRVIVSDMSFDRERAQ